jgi:hypothetical protein
MTIGPFLGNTPDYPINVFGALKAGARVVHLTPLDGEIALVLLSQCAFRRRRPRCPAHGDHLIRSMTTRAAQELDGAVGCGF